MASRARVGSVARPRPRPRPRPRAAKGDGDRLREEILAATEKLLIKAGDVDAVSIRAIADAVGVTPPSLYLHFPDKHELMLAVCQAQFTRLEQKVAKALAPIADPVGRVRAMGAVYVRFGVDHPEQYRILLMTKGEFTREDFERGDAPGANAFLQLLSLVQECMDAGVFRPADPFVVATGLWATVHGLTSLRIAMPTFPMIGEPSVLDHLLDVQLRGLA